MAKGEGPCHAIPKGDQGHPTIWLLFIIQFKAKSIPGNGQGREAIPCLSNGGRCPSPHLASIWNSISSEVKPRAWPVERAIPSHSKGVGASHPISLLFVIQFEAKSSPGHGQGSGATPGHSKGDRDPSPYLAFI